MVGVRPSAFMVDLSNFVKHLNNGINSIISSDIQTVIR